MNSPQADNNQGPDSEQEVRPAATTPPTPLGEGPGTRIGPYKLLQKIGEGGMGVVYMAEQEHPVRRRVALKVIKPGMDTAQVVARFDAERQALAMMDHLHIARVLDAGATESGRPYFVMELVHGIPITRYCDENKLTPRERLPLFVCVCQAIQHAHQKGIIHRDIKPSNVLVTLYDGKPVAKVIDFGVAKATEQRLTERTMFTQFGGVVGTIEYMSPEQAELSALGVDTRSDVYSLGVLLYELLTGSTPLERKQIHEVAYVEVIRMIKEDEPPKPSTRLSQSGEELPAISSKRGTPPAQLRNLVRGELDWIVMKCLEKDRTRRYETANGLARDIERYLDDEPVMACPPSGGYRLRKFVRKHRAGLAMATTVAVLLLSGFAVSTWQAVRATRAEAATRDALVAEEEQRRLVEQAERAARSAAQAEKQSKEAAQQREAETRAVLDFVEQRVFAAARPEGQEGGLGRQVTLRSAVETALPFIATSFRDQPLIEARLRTTLGTSFRYLGEVKLAAEQLEMARALYTKVRGQEHPDTLMSMHNLANSYADLGRHADALKLREETLATRKAALGPDHPDTLASMHGVAESYRALGRYDDALKLEQETLALRKASLGLDHLDTLASMDGAANSYMRLGRYADALKLEQETLALRKAKLGADHPDTLNSMRILAHTYGYLNRHADALELYEETLAIQKAQLGPNHPATLSTMNGLSLIYGNLGRHTDALKLHEETLAIQQAKLGPDHPDTLTSMNNIAWSLLTAPDVKLWDPARALELAKKAAEATPTNPDYLGTFGTARYRTGDWKGAVEILDKTIALRRPGDPFNACEGFFLAMAHWQLGEKDQAREWFAKSVQWMANGQQDHPAMKRFRTEAAELLGTE